MSEATLVINNVTGRRGRGPGHITFSDGMEASTFDGSLLKLAAEAIGQSVKVAWIEKPGKKEGEIYKNLTTLELLESAVRVQEALEGTENGQGIPEQRLVPIRASQTLVASPIAALEQNFALAVRQRELLEGFIRARFKEGEHYMDGKTFGSKKKVLLQPGAQLILYCHGFVVDFELTGPMTAPAQDVTYTIVTKAIVKNIDGRQVGSGVGSCSSHIWSGRDMRYKLRAVSPDLGHNSCLKISKKRALVDACLNATAAAEYFSQDEEFYLAEQEKEREQSEDGGFIGHRKHAG